MIKRMKKNVVLLLTMTLLLSLIQVPERALAQDALDINAGAAILVEASTGKILYAKNEDAALGIASMTKMMSEYLLFEAIHDKKITWDQEQTISEFVHQVSIDMSLSNVPLNAGTKFTIEELYEAMAIYSANGATIAIAEAIAGSETEFVKMMNNKAKELGLENYQFVNSTGLNNRDLKGKHPEGTGPDDENVMSARSTAELAVRLLADFPEVLETTSTPVKEFPGMPGEMKNWNWMLPGLIFEYPGVDGLKTGTTDFAGYCFTGTALRDDLRVITVVMDAKGADGYKSRFDETKKMMDYAFTNYSIKELYPKGYEIKGAKTLPVVKGKEKLVNIQSQDSLKIVMKNGDEKSYKPLFKVDKKKVNKEGQLTAPLKKNEKVGTLEAVYEGKDQFGYVKKGYKPTVDMVTANEVEKANWFVLMMRGVGGFFSDIWTSVANMVKGWF